MPGASFERCIGQSDPRSAPGVRAVDPALGRNVRADPSSNSASSGPRAGRSQRERVIARMNISLSDTSGRLHPGHLRVTSRGRPLAGVPDDVTSAEPTPRPSGGVPTLAGSTRHETCSLFATRIVSAEQHRARRVRRVSLASRAGHHSDPDSRRVQYGNERTERGLGLVFGVLSVLIGGAFVYVGLCPLRGRAPSEPVHRSPAPRSGRGCRWFGSFESFVTDGRL